MRLLILASRYRALMPYIVAQAKHETNGFASNIYLKTNNMFGMKNGSYLGPGEIIGPVSPEGNTYAAYVTDADSLGDLLRWFDAKGMPVMVDSSDEYVVALINRGWLGNPPPSGGLEIYKRGVRRWL